jgi:hypothetical protein
MSVLEDALYNDNQGGGGDVVGPASATNNAVALFDGATGKLIKNSGVIVDGSNNISGGADLSISGNLTLSGSAKRIIGDFSNATRANRVSFQTSTTNGATGINAIPNGTSTVSSFIAYGVSDPDNSSFAQFYADDSSHVGVNSGKTGTGTTLPFVVQMNSSTVFTVGTTGEITTVSAITNKVSVITSAGAVSVGASDYIVVINKTVGEATTVNLPVGVAGRYIVIKDTVD